MHVPRLASRRLVPASAALGALALLASCATQGSAGAASASPPSGEASGPASATGTAFVLWSQPAEGRASSRWFDAAGREQGRADGVWIASAEQLFRISSRERVAPGTPCDAGFEADERTRAWLVAEPAGGGAAVTLTQPTAMETEPGSSQQAAWLRGSIGSTLIFVDELSAYYCGAHGSTTATFAAVDVATGAPVMLAPPTEAARADGLRRGAAALRALSAELDGEPDAIGAALPRFNRRRGGRSPAGHRRHLLRVFGRGRRQLSRRGLG